MIEEHRTRVAKNWAVAAVYNMIAVMAWYLAEVGI